MLWDTFHTILLPIALCFVLCAHNIALIPCEVVYADIKSVCVGILTFLHAGCHLFLSDSGEQALLVSSSLEIYLWELTEGHCSEWWQITAPEGLSLPCGPETRETAIDACFFVHQARV